MRQPQLNKSPQEINAFEFNNCKFIRRPDLSKMDRIYIAYTALWGQQHKSWGIVTELSKEYIIS